MRRSVIRDLLSVATRPEIISFAGGFPNAETFPIEELKKIMMKIMDEQGAIALQYGPTEGYIPFKQEILKRCHANGMSGDLGNLIITTASQQALDLISRIFINPHDVVLCGLPSYLGALQAFWSYQAEPYGVRDGEDNFAIMEKLISQGKKPKFLYAIPDFQNPSGVTMTLEERKDVIELSRKYDLYIIEDSPYREIRFEGEPQPTMYSMAPDRVILLGTFSKTFVPGFRLGYILANHDIIEHIVVAKQSSDLCTPTFNQMVAAEYMKSGLYEKNIGKICELYHHKKDLMIQSFEKYMPEGVTWTNPEGGLFLFLKLPEQYDTRELFDIAIKKNVAFVIGEAFHCDGSGKNTMRLNFSYATDEKIVEGVKRLSDSINELYGRHA
ncbi:MAG: PLP-dependent aminotransferase family protein [Bacteroidales bacterium]|nr:PLP-dependent aminotransferase family protein [Bacteroidales bacterium]MCI2122364.1 PLP-dependent aminotransferase family protein [Bacteroidales bacterium]MCI2145676.1 PLP-dependent aminotransferase family protein [Bacteroidales bacterium]